ncbi:hypothetical protein B0J12DRAFT_683358 [Macrophomina phaseolina]|uniref:Uncharacterized protein n=1 Tax=Macrophomina phaseolina TaxID=35725 RepID=A0ABQ8FV04_9PEZI|nr:hypothetical protein B0J12DRAFT_683358 [Macrophomina phaseolina]
MAQSSGHYHSQTPVEVIKKKEGLNQQQWERFLIHSRDEVDELVDGKAYWDFAKREKPHPVTWKHIEGNIQEELVKRVNKKMKGNNVEITWELMRWRLLPRLRQKSKNPVQSASLLESDTSKEDLPELQPHSSGRKGLPFDPVADALGRNKR